MDALKRAREPTVLTRLLAEAFAADTVSRKPQPILCMWACASREAMLTAPSLFDSLGVCGAARELYERYWQLMYIPERHRGEALQRCLQEALDAVTTGSAAANMFPIASDNALVGRYQRALVFCFVNDQLSVAWRLAAEMQAVRCQER